VAKGVTIIAVQVLSCQGSGSGAGVIAGIEWAVQDAARHPTERSIISMSLGGGFSSVENAAVKAAHDQNVLVVAAAGNDDSNACNYSPASAPEAITVGSTTSGDDKSGFSNHGSCVDIHAPGSRITAAYVTSDTSTTTMSGTSMAAPHVAGAAAQLRAARPEFNTAQVSEALVCMSTSNAINGLPGSDTANRLLYAGAAMADQDMTSCNFPPSPPALPPPPAPPPGQCTNNCNYARDGDCDDGGSGSEYSYCSLGTDCFDCERLRDSNSACSQPASPCLRAACLPVACLTAA
jgi:subtilisin family serine protease